MSGVLQSMGSQRVGHNSVAEQQLLEHLGISNLTASLKRICYKEQNAATGHARSSMMTLGGESQMCCMKGQSFLCY